MNIDRLIGIIGVCLSALGFFTLPTYSVSWFILILGIVFLIYSFYLLKRKSKNVLDCIYEYTFGEDRKLVEVKKITTWKINKDHITRLESGHIISTGLCKNFKSNIGTIKQTTLHGGSINIICDLQDNAIKGNYISWILTYDMIDAFNESSESVAMSGYLPEGDGALYVKFSNKDIPKKIWKTAEKYKQDINLNTYCPEVFWKFKIKHHTTYIIHWEW